jgi:hypothetical protein
VRKLGQNWQKAALYLAEIISAGFFFARPSRIYLCHGGKYAQTVIAFGNRNCSCSSTGRLRINLHLEGWYSREHQALRPDNRRLQAYAQWTFATGIQAKAVQSSEFASMLQRYATLPRGRAGIKNAGEHRLGNAHEAFARSDIDGLIIIAGDTNIWRSAFLRTMGKIAVNTAATLATGIVSGGGGPDAVTTMEMSVITPDGRFVHHYGDYFTYKKGTLTLKKGDILDPEQRKEILEIHVNKYRSEAEI